MELGSQNPYSISPTSKDIISNILERTGIIAHLFMDDISITEVESPGFSASISPNPVTSYFNLKINSSDHHTPVSVRILNTVGKLMGVYKPSANSNLRIPTGEWMSGVYFVEVTQGKNRRIIKFLKAGN